MHPIYKLLQKIPKGKVTTYKVLGLATNLNPRTVGKILHVNPDPDNCPCHRVIKSDGTIASGYAMGGPTEQVRKLKEEGVCFIGNKVDLQEALCILD